MAGAIDVGGIDPLFSKLDLHSPRRKKNAARCVYGYEQYGSEIMERFVTDTVY